MHTPHARFFTTFFASSVMITAIYCAPAHDVMQELMVTARRRAESLTDVASTIAAFPVHAIARAGSGRARDFALLTPGVSLANSGEAGDTRALDYRF